MTSTCKMAIDLNVLGGLGMSRYTNIATILTEAIANAWDADARKVDIRIDPKAKSIEIRADGIGMSADEINDECIRVGYNRRGETGGRVMRKSRPVIGSKGLRKLSLFATADTLEVHSAKDDAAHRLRMIVSSSTQRISK